jgi:hypothetical protein
MKRIRWDLTSSIFTGSHGWARGLPCLVEVWTRHLFAVEEPVATRKAALAGGGGE